MEGLLVSAATGALKPVLQKLGALMGDEYKRFKGVRREVQSLTDELAAMHAFLVKMSEEENPNVQDKAWVKEVREMSYDIEDSLDEFMLSVDDESASPHGFIDKVKNLLSMNKIRTRHRIAKAIEGLKVEVEEMGRRNQRYKTRDVILKTSNATVDPRALVIFEDALKLVGIDGPKGELIELLKNDNSVSSQQLKVVSIVGCGGIGKTTLAHRVYQELKGGFKCEAFLSVSRNPDILKVLGNILCQVCNRPHHNIGAWDIQLLIRKIINSLEDKRYLIVVDDIWEKDTWKTISCAFPKNTKGSRIITTTRKHDIAAQSCCSSDGVGVYKIKPLNPKDSKRLFLNRIFGCEDMCPPQLKDVSDNILRKCQGLPLAIISVSGLLANRSHVKDEWDRVYNSIGRELAKDPNVETMTHILSLSYIDLPHHLKTCLLYLSIFPEDYTIDKLRLVRRWIAEGFIHSEGGKTLYELGERCFNELINRSLIQPCAINKYHEVKACRVHDIILDFIVSKSAEENFSTVTGDSNDQKLASVDKVRRLSLHHGSQKNVSLVTKLKLSNVRSLSVLQLSMSDLLYLRLLELEGFEQLQTHHHLDLVGCEQLEGHYLGLQLSSLLNMRFLRVLDIEGCKQLEGHHLACIYSLFQLKYLSLKYSGISDLPETIGRLQHLETLIIQNTRVTELPVTITRLSSLVCLVVDKEIRLPDGIGSMTTLEVLKWVNVFRQSINFIQDLGKLEKLRSLHLFLHHDSFKKYASELECHLKEYKYSIVSSLCKLSTCHLDCFSIDTDSIYEEHGFPMDLWHTAPCSLRKLVVKDLLISSVPKWTHLLSNLQMSVLFVKVFKKDDLRALGGLPCLIFLRLVVERSFKGRIIINGRDGFQCLRSFEFGSAVLVTFAAGAMPKLENLSVMFSSADTKAAYIRHSKGESKLLSWREVSRQLMDVQYLLIGDFAFGIDHLCNLNNINCTIHGDNRRNASEAIRRAVHAHPRFPEGLICRFRWTSRWIMGESKEHEEVLREQIMVTNAALKFIERFKDL